MVSLPEKKREDCFLHNPLIKIVQSVGDQTTRIYTETKKPVTRTEIFDKT